MRNEYWDLTHVINTPTHNQAFRLHYRCTHCERFDRFFFVHVDEKADTLTKIGQFPSWEIRSDQLIEQLLGNHAQYFRRGLVCESQSYGIGAFGYYRRIVEEIIDQLLEQVTGLLSGDDLEKYSTALKKVNETVVTQEKLDLIKDLLPATLRPNNVNPLSVLHSALSEGLHAESDEECLEQAAAVREILIFLVNQISASRESQKAFTAGMKKFLDKKAEQSKEKQAR